jgi:hypothetical protein
VSLSAQRRRAEERRVKLSPVVSLEQDMKVKGLFGWEAMAYTSAEWSEHSDDKRGLNSNFTTDQKMTESP